MDHPLKNPVLSEDNVHSDPFRQFDEWYGEAYRLMGEEASAMVVSTSLENQPSSRIVYLRGQDDNGFWFFTNYDGNKGRELIANPKASLLFYWPRVLRQVRIKGLAEKLEEKHSDEYFATRARDSQIGAWASEQSRKIRDRKELQDRFNSFSEKFKDQKVTRPPHWGGFRIKPTSFEFWQGRENRLHDRFLYSLENNIWSTSRLSP